MGKRKGSDIREKGDYYEGSGEDSDEEHVQPKPKLQRVTEPKQKSSPDKKIIQSKPKLQHMIIDEPDKEAVQPKPKSVPKPMPKSAPKPTSKSVPKPASKSVPKPVPKPTPKQSSSSGSDSNEAEGDSDIQEDGLIRLSEDELARIAGLVENDDDVAPEEHEIDSESLHDAEFGLPDKEEQRQEDANQAILPSEKSRKEASELMLRHTRKRLFSAVYSSVVHSMCIKNVEGSVVNEMEKELAADVLTTKLLHDAFNQFEVLLAKSKSYLHGNWAFGTIQNFSVGFSQFICWLLVNNNGADNLFDFGNTDVNGLLNDFCAHLKKMETKPTIDRIIRCEEGKNSIHCNKYSALTLHIYMRGATAFLVVLNKVSLDVYMRFYSKKGGDFGMMKREYDPSVGLLKSVKYAIFLADVQMFCEKSCFLHEGAYVCSLAKLRDMLIFLLFAKTGFRASTICGRRENKGKDAIKLSEINISVHVSRLVVTLRPLVFKGRRADRTPIAITVLESQDKFDFCKLLLVYLNGRRSLTYDLRECIQQQDFSIKEDAKKLYLFPQIGKAGRKTGTFTNDNIGFYGITRLCNEFAVVFGVAEHNVSSVSFRKGCAIADVVNLLDANPRATLNDVYASLKSLPNWSSLACVPYISALNFDFKDLRTKLIHRSDEGSFAIGKGDAWKYVATASSVGSKIVTPTAGQLQRIAKFKEEDAKAATMELQAQIKFIQNVKEPSEYTLVRKKLLMENLADLRNKGTKEISLLEAKCRYRLMQKASENMAEHFVSNNSTVTIDLMETAEARQNQSIPFQISLTKFTPNLILAGPVECPVHGCPELIYSADEGIAHVKTHKFPRRCRCHNVQLKNAKAFEVHISENRPNAFCHSCMLPFITTPTEANREGPIWHGLSSDKKKTKFGNGGSRAVCHDEINPEQKSVAFGKNFIFIEMTEISTRLCGCSIEKCCSDNENVRTILGEYFLRVAALTVDKKGFSENPVASMQNVFLKLASRIIEESKLNINCLTQTFARCFSS